MLNVMNFNKGAAGEPTLLSFDDARTLFHEFGHGLHGLMSDVTYPMISGTGVLQDFVELPSQLYEHWLDRPEILTRFARHYQTGEPMPQALMDRLIASRTFNQGFTTTEYLGSTYVDLDFHLGGAEGRAHGRDGDAQADGDAARGRDAAPAAALPAHLLGRSAMRPATTATCGPRCSTPTRSTPSRRRATYSIRRSRSGCATTSTRRAARASPPRPTGIPRPDAVRRPAAEEARARGRSMNLYSAGHRRGVVAAPHHAAAEAGRAMLAEGGNAIEAMVAMAADDRCGLSAHEPYRRRWLLARARTIRARTRVDGGGSGGCEGNARASIARTATTRFRRAGRSPPSRCRRAVASMDARPAGGRSLRGQAAARRAARSGDPPCARGLQGHAQPGAAHRRKARRVPGRARICQDVPGRWQAASRRRDPEAGGARRDARPARQCGAWRFLSWRCRARDRGRSGPDRLAGHARRSRALRGEGRRAALGRSAVRHGLQYAAAHAGTGLAHHPGIVRAACA